MTAFNGHLRKMQAKYNNAQTPVEYSLVLVKEPSAPAEQITPLVLNSLLGKKLTIRFKQEIHCVSCGRKIKKGFNQGHCYPCFTRLASCDKCIMSPEKCHYEQGTCREPEWAQTHCMQSHFVYLANSTGIKVGITRGDQLPTRWLDQGAIQALPIFKVSQRYYSGLVEILYKQEVSDRTQWQRMLKGQVEEVDLLQKQTQLYELFAPQLEEIKSELPENAIVAMDNTAMTEILYPVLEYPTKIKSFNLDKEPLVEGILMGIKGQYLILDTGVINIRKFSGYHVEIEA